MLDGVPINFRSEALRVSDLDQVRYRYDMHRLACMLCAVNQHRVAWDHFVLCKVNIANEVDVHDKMCLFCNL